MSDVDLEDPAAAARAAIVAWANAQELWKQDALRRVLQSDHTAEDVEAVKKALLDYIDGELNDLKPLTIDELGGACGTDGIEAINELRDVSRTNRLADGQALKFGSSGLTVVYGHNGSGKSGYARVFKRACGARDSEKILPDVYKEADGVAAGATFSVTKAGGQVELKWSDADGSVDELTCVCTFDSKNAPFYVERKAGLSYTPYGLACFERLADLLDAVASDVDTAMTAIRAQCAVPLIDPPSPPFVDDFLAKLAEKSDDEIDAFLSWTEADQKSLEFLADAAKDPHAKVKALSNAAESLHTRKTDLDSYVSAGSAEAAARAVELVAEAYATRKAATLAASDIFAGEPLKGVGDAAWLKLFNAAAEYSINVAYPGREAPAADPGDRCVLCLRELDEETQARFGKFKAWVQDDAQKKADAAEAKLSAEKSRYAALSQGLGLINIDPSVTAEAPDVSVRFAEVKASLAARIEFVAARLGGGNPEVAPAIVTAETMSAFDTAADELAKSADRIQKLIDGGEATDLAARASALEKRHALSQSSQAVKERKARLLALARYEKVKPLVNTVAISKKGGELLKQYVTNRLELEFENARKDFGVEDLEVRFSASSKKGGVERAIDLNQSVVKTAPNLVLSEGEHRAVALAAFLAEVAVSPGKAPIVVDDPVSSLDHKRRERVARRLAREAQHRQVIVFTHDVVFLVMLEEACALFETPLERIMIERGGKSFGVVSKQPAPWDAMKFAERRALLAQKLEEIQHHHKEFGEDEKYKDLVSNFYDRLRRTWERGVEELVLNDVVKRFRTSIQTMRLKRVAFDDEIYKALEAGMTAASKMTGHDQAEALGDALPSPADLGILFEQLKKFQNLVKKKAAEAEAARSQVAAASQVGA